MPLKTQQEINDIFAQKKEDRLKFFYQNCDINRIFKFSWLFVINSLDYFNCSNLCSLLRHCLLD